MAAATSAQWHSNPLNPTSAAPPPQYVVPSSAGVNEQPLPQATSTSPSPFQPPTAMRSHAGGVTVDLQLERTLFVARGVLAGRVLVNVDRAKGVKVGRISVEVFGYEETTPSKSAHRRLLLHHIMPLQEALNASAMPTDVVVPGPPDEHSMWPARKGKHALPFAIPLENARNGTDGVRVEVEGPRPLPSSFWSRGVGGVRYIVTCTIDIKTGNSRPLAPLTTYTPFLLLESLPLKLSGGPQHFESTLEAGSLLASEMTTVVNGRYLFGLGKKGEIKLRASAKIPTSVPAAETGYQPAENVWLAGSTGLVGVEIENGCQRRITALKIRLIRRLKTFSQHANTPVNPPNNLNTTTTTLFAEAASSTLLPLSFSREVIAKRCWRYKKTEQLFEEDANKTQEVLAWKGVGRGETRAMVVDLAIPIVARSIRYAALLDVSYVIQVSIKPNGSGPLFVEIPITILHPASLYQNLPLPQSRTTAKPSATAPPITIDNRQALYTDPHVDQRGETPFAPSPARQSASLELNADNVALAAERDEGSESISEASLSKLTASPKRQVANAGGTVSSIRAVEALRSVSVSGPRGSVSRIGSVAGTLKGVDKLGSISLQGKGLASIPNVEMHCAGGSNVAAARNAEYDYHFSHNEDGAGNITDGSDSIVPPENPPSPAARRALLSSPVGTVRTAPSAPSDEGSVNPEEISATIDRMFEGLIPSH